MARILYSVCGEGMGHAIRSDTILSELVKKHDVIITAAERSYPFLKRRYGGMVKKIEGNTYVYKDNEIRIARTVLKLFWNLPVQVKKNTSIMRTIIRRFRPEIIISDFESAARYFARLYRIPSISIDNIHALTECDTGFDKPFYLDCVIRFLQPRSDYYIIPSISDVKPLSDRVHVVHPIIREDVRKLKPRKRKFAVAYQTSETNDKMLPVLERSGSEFRIYGMGKRRKRGGLVFKEFSDKGFLKDLSECKYVIINGGFTLLSEALYLRKPVLAIPVAKQSEQEYNAETVKNLSYGTAVKELNLQNLDVFESNLGKYRNKLNKIKEWSNDDTLRLIEKIIARHS